MKSLLNLIQDLFSWIFNLIKKICLQLYEKFLVINIFEKCIVMMTIFAFAAVVAPMARYMIFDTYFTINNPAAHYLIGIVLVMLVTVYFPGFIPMIIRAGLNLFYLINIIYLQAAHEISKAPYELTAGYYLNIICPVVYIILALGSGLLHRDY
jgi:hypothetical protein